MLVFEYAKGTILSLVKLHKKRNNGLLANVITQVLKGLQFIHSLGYIHSGTRAFPAKFFLNINVRTDTFGNKIETQFLTLRFRRQSKQYFGDARQTSKNSRLWVHIKTIRSDHRSRTTQRNARIHCARVFSRQKMGRKIRRLVHRHCVICALGQSLSLEIDCRL